MDLAMLLLSLPTNVAALVLSDWVGVEGTVRLDSAFCNSATRSQFHDTIISTECVLKPQESKNNTDNLVLWATLRGVRVENLRIVENSDLQSCERFLVKQGATVMHVRLISLISSSEQELGLISSYCNHISHLHLRRCRIDSTFCSFLTSVSSLRELHIDIHPTLTDLTAEQLGPISCPHLRMLWLSWCTRPGLVSAFLKMAVNVTSLRLSHCHRLSTHIIQHINSSVTSLSIINTICTNELLVEVVNQCPSIVSLDLDSSATDLDLDLKSGIEYAAKHLTHLRALNLSGNNISDACLQALATYRASTLTDLFVFPCYSLTTVALNTMLHACINLTAIAFRQYHHTEIVDASLMNRITSLFVTYEGALSQKFVHSIAQHCAQLRRFSVYIADNSGVSDLDTIVLQCRRLTHLSVEEDGGSTVTPAVLARWRAWRPDLTVSVEFSFRDELVSFGGFR